MEEIVDFLFEVQGFTFVVQETQVDDERAVFKVVATKGSERHRLEVTLREIRPT
jgi:hypothetical protein